MTRTAPVVCFKVLLLLFATVTHSQQPDASAWPTITQEAKPWTRWWWPGSAVDQQGVTRQLQMFAEAGLGGVEVTPIYGARGADERYIPFLSPRWMGMLAHASREAERFGLGVDMATGTGWPFGGPTVDPMHASQKVKLTDGLLGGEPTGMKVKRAAPGGEGLVLDPYSSAALSRYLRPFSVAFEASPGIRIRSQFHDSFEYYGASWTSQLPKVFLDHHGYDIQAYAPQLLDQQPAENDTLARLKSDYREVLARLHLDYLRTWVTWSHAHGFMVRNQSHGAPANLLDLYGAVDIPETESFGSSAFAIAGLRRDPAEVRADHTPPHPLMYRMASSAAHVMGRQLVSSETGTWLREHWKEAPAAAKPQIDQLFTAGINHIFYHGTTYTPEDVTWPGWYFYASTQLSVTNPMWREFAVLNDYVARVQSVLQSGTSDNDVLLYLPFADVLDNPQGLIHQYGVENAHWLLDSAVGRTALRLEAAGYAFDFVSDDQLLQTRLEGSELRTPGNRYRAIVVPATRRMPVATLAHLSKLVDGGATVLFEALPQDVPGFGRLEERRRKFSALLKAPVIAKAAIGAEVNRALAERNVRRESLVETGLNYIRRAQPSGHDYFIVNMTATHFNGWIELGTAARSAVILDPLTGQAGKAALKADDQGKTQVYLQLASGESLLLRAAKSGTTYAGFDPWRYLEPTSEPIELSGDWNVTFMAGGPTLPKPVAIRTLTSWLDLGDEARRFAGTARYRIEFEVPARSADEWLLDLGEVREAARVRLNGWQIANACCLPYRVRLGALTQKRNVLEIDVTNLAANRIRDLEHRKVPWRVMKDVDIVNIHYRPFDASQWDLVPSGLLGPVSLIPMKHIRL